MVCHKMLNLIPPLIPFSPQTILFANKIGVMLIVIIQVYYCKYIKFQIINYNIIPSLI